MKTSAKTKEGLHKRTAGDDKGPLCVSAKQNNALIHLVTSRTTSVDLPDQDLIVIERVAACHGSSFNRRVVT